MSGLDDDVSDMVGDFLEFHGESRTYRRGASSTTITLARLTQRPVVVDVNGMLLEVRETAWICLTDDLPYGDPEAGDQIDDGSLTYEVQPTSGEKCFRRLSPSLTRIHTKLIN